MPAMTAFRLPPGPMWRELRRRRGTSYRIEGPIIDRPDCHLLRVSTHFYNTVEEVDRLAEAVPSLLG